MSRLAYCHVHDCGVSEQDIAEIPCHCQADKLSLVTYDWWSWLQAMKRCHTNIANAAAEMQQALPDADAARKGAT